MNAMRKLAWLAVGLLALTACAPGHRAPRGVEPVYAQNDAGLLLESQVFFYPPRRQSEERQSRDRYECYLWAVRQTGFDPSKAELAPHQRVRAIAVPPPGHQVFQGALAGAVVGSMIGYPHHTGDGAAIGAGVGALAGAAQAAHVRRQVADYQTDLEARRHAEIERLAHSYRRAMSACLEGRGYSVR
jgi:hypothetical protein